MISGYISEDSLTELWILSVACIFILYILHYKIKEWFERKRREREIKMRIVKFLKDAETFCNEIDAQLK